MDGLTTCTSLAALTILQAAFGLQMYSAAGVYLLLYMADGTINSVSYAIIDITPVKFSVQAGKRVST